MRSVKTVLIFVIIPGMFLSLGGWSLSQASKNNQAIINVKAEYRLLITTLNRIETGTIILNKKQEVLNTRMSNMNTAQALTNQKIIDYIIIDNRRTYKLQDRMDKHTHR